MMPRKRKFRKDLPTRVYLKHGAYYFVTNTNKWIKLAKIGEERQMKIAWANFEQPAEAEYTTESLINDYLINYSSQFKAHRTYQDNLKEAEYLKIYFGDMFPQDILPRHVGAYLDANARARPVRANREKALLSHIFTWAMRHDKWGKIVTHNPCKGVHRNKESKRIRIISDTEYLQLYQMAPRIVQRLMTLIYRTLQRPSDILRLGSRNLEKVDVDGKEVIILKLLQSKTNEGVRIILTEEALNALYDGRARDTFYDCFFTNNIGNQYTLNGVNSFYHRTFTLYASQIKQDKGVNPQRFGLYDLKGKGATDMYQAGVPVEKIQMLCGHQSIKTTEIYIKARLKNPIKSNDRKLG